MRSWMGKSLNAEKFKLFRSEKRTSGKRVGKLRSVNGCCAGIGFPAESCQRDVSNQRNMLRSSFASFALRAATGAALGKSMGNPLCNVRLPFNCQPPTTPFSTGCIDLPYVLPRPKGSSHVARTDSFCGTSYCTSRCSSLDDSGSARLKSWSFRNETASRDLEIVYAA